MTPTQRAAAERLADELQRFDGTERESLRDEAAALLRELAAEPAPGYCKHCKQYTIEQPLPAEPDEDAQYRCGGPGCDGNCCQPVQEPVALMWQHEETGRVTFTTMADPYVGKRWHRIPLYAHPPQQRKPLDATAVQELKLAVSGKPYLTVEQLVRQVERAHGITGEPT